MLQGFQLQQQMMNNDTSRSGVNLKFDGSNTMSSNRSFVSSLSMDNSVASLSMNSFQLIGLPQSSDPNSHHLRRKCVKGEDGSMKCGSSSKCHCSKKRLSIFLLFLVIFFINFVGFWKIYLGFIKQENED